MKRTLESSKDYTPSSTPEVEPTPPEAEPAPPAPKEEKVEQPSSTPEPKTSKPSAPLSGDRLFASPLARKFAEDNKHQVVKKLLRNRLSPLILRFQLWTMLTSLILRYERLQPHDWHSQSKLFLTITYLSMHVLTNLWGNNYLLCQLSIDKQFYMCSLRSQLNSFQVASGGKRISINDLVVKKREEVVVVVQWFGSFHKEKL